MAPTPPTDKITIVTTVSIRGSVVTLATIWPRGWVADLRGQIVDHGERRRSGGAVTPPNQSAGRSSVRVGTMGPPANGRFRNWTYPRSVNIPRTLSVVVVGATVIVSAGCAQSVSTGPSGLRGQLTKETCDLGYSPESDWVFPQEQLVEAVICESDHTGKEVTVTSVEKLATLREVLGANDDVPTDPDQACTLEAYRPIGVTVVTKTGIRVAAHIPTTICGRYQAAPREFVRSLLMAKS